MNMRALKMKFAEIDARLDALESKKAAKPKSKSKPAPKAKK